MSVPKEVQEMRDQLAEVRRGARVVKQSWRNIRLHPKSEKLAAVVDSHLELYDEQHPDPHTDDTTKRVDGDDR